VCIWFPEPHFFHKVLTSRFSVLRFAGVLKNVAPANGEGVLYFRSYESLSSFPVCVTSYTPICTLPSKLQPDKHKMKHPVRCGDLRRPTYTVQIVTWFVAQCCCAVSCRCIPTFLSSLPPLFSLYSSYFSIVVWLHDSESSAIHRSGIGNK
jgi:hypothetical protein